MKLFAWGLLATSVVSFDFEVWDQSNEDAFAWLEPKSRLRREGDADDKNVLKFEEAKTEPLKATKSGKSKKKPELDDLMPRRGEKRNKSRKNINWKLKKPSKKNTEDYYYDDYADYDDGDYNPEDYQPIDFSIVDYDTQVEEIEAELEDLVGQLMEMRSLDTTSENEDSKYVMHKEEHKDDKKDKKAMEKLAILGFRRKNLGRKLTEDEKSTRQRIRAARRRRKQLRRIEQERRKEWRQLHRDKETGDYDEHGPYQGSVEKSNSKRENRRDRRKNRLKNKTDSKNKTGTTPAPTKKSKKKKTTQAVQTTKPSTTPKPVKTTISNDRNEPATTMTGPVLTTAPETTTTTTERPTTTQVITMSTVWIDSLDNDASQFGRERVYSPKSFFENETFQNATGGNIEFGEFEFAKNEAAQFDDFAGQNTLEKYELLKYMMLYLQPAEFQDWNRFSGYGCWCFQNVDNEFWKGQGLPKDEIDKTCRKLSMCYHCIGNDYPVAMCSPETRYNFIGLEDSVTSDRFIECLDQHGSCERHICECDKKFAEGLRTQAETTNLSLDRNWGGFDQAAECKQQLGTPPWDACCGDYPTRMPYSTQGSRGCCKDQTYDTSFNQCCDERIVSHSATCSAN